MTDLYTYIAKPTDSTYSNVNTIGKQQYDQSTLLYDDHNTFYDGIDMFAYTNLAKPISGQTTLRIGTITGLLMPITYATIHTFGISPYTFIAKPTT